MRFTLFFLSLLLPFCLQAATAKPLTREEVKSIVREIIKEEPEIIIESLNGWQKKQEDAAKGKASQALIDKKAELEDDKNSPIMGNPKGDVTIVEFFDYNCGYCKRFTSVLDTLTAEDKNLRVVFKEFPVLGASSELAAKAATALYRLKPEAYLQYHNALMAYNGSLDETALLAEAEKLGVAKDVLKAEILKPEVADAVNKTRALGFELGIRGTPAIIVNNELIPGAVGADMLKEKIAAARAKKK